MPPDDVTNVGDGVVGAQPGAAGGTLPAGDGAAGGAAAGGEAIGELSEWEKLPPWARSNMNRHRDRAKLLEDKTKTLEQELADARAESQRLRELTEAQNRARAAAAVAAGAGDGAGSGSGTVVPPVASAGASAPSAVLSDDDPRVQARAEQIAQQRQNAQALVDLNTKGLESYGGQKWEKALNDLKALGGFDQGTLDQIVATDNPSRVLYELGTNPALYQRVTDPLLTSAKRMTEFLKISMAAAANGAGAAGAGAGGKKPSDAPAPVDAIAGRGGGSLGKADLYDPKFYDAQPGTDADDAWYAERRRQKMESRGKPWSPPRAA